MNYILREKDGKHYYPYPTIRSKAMVFSADYLQNINWSWKANWVAEELETITITNCCLCGDQLAWHPSDKPGTNETYCPACLQVWLKEEEEK